MMKKLMASGIILGLLAVVSPASVLAAYTTSNVTQAEASLKQIKLLQDQLAELLKQRGTVTTELKDALAVVADLRQGMTSEEVKALQEILAADPEVYPEGTVTGYFGPLTARAVAKFQKKHGIEGEVAVGAKTRARLNTLVGDKDFRCKAWGKLVASGQAKKRLGNASVDLSVCAKVPPGIKDKIDKQPTASTTPDRFPPVISSIKVDDITEEGAVITWLTNEPTSAVVWYSTDREFDESEREKLSAFTKEHEVELEGLEEDEEYFFRIEVKDESGNVVTSRIEDFDTE